MQGKGEGGRLGWGGEGEEGRLGWGGGEGRRGGWVGRGRRGSNPILCTGCNCGVGVLVHLVGLNVVGLLRVQFKYDHMIT